MPNRRAAKVCSRPGCPNLTQAGRCGDCRAQAERDRGSPTDRGYGHDHRTRFRLAVLARDPVCVLCHQQPSRHADHHPIDRRNLVAQGLDPNDPGRGRGLCGNCHSRATAANQPGGWNAS
jgi:5-methylcytosine-specific restriction enzyme A